MLRVPCGENVPGVHYYWTGPNYKSFSDSLILVEPLKTRDNATNYTCNVLLTKNPTKCPVQNQTITLHIRGNSSVVHLHLHFIKII